MIPTAATNRGTDRVEAIDPKAAGYAVHTTVRTNTSQTWLASQTGAIDSCAWSRMRCPSAPPPAVSCQIPAPKSAPPRPVYSARPTSAKISGSSYRCIGHLERRPRQPPQDPDDGERDADVDEHQRRLADRHAAGARHRL